MCLFFMKKLRVCFKSRDFAFWQGRKDFKTGVYTAVLDDFKQVLLNDSSNDNRRLLPGFFVRLVNCYIILILFNFIVGSLPFHSVAIKLAHSDESEMKCIEASITIVQKLKCLMGLTVEEVSLSEGVPKEMKQFELRFLQPIDHQNPRLGTFSQRLVLLHRSIAEPMVLQTSGYEIFGIRPAAITARFHTNQIQVEHRYFAQSTPEPKYWEKLTIYQSAQDFHRIVIAFKQIYNNNWVNTGASKGGMTSIYHKRFFPEDLNGTVADVAPLSFGTKDDRYNTFLRTVGAAPYEKCRNDMWSLQKTLLENRDIILPKISGDFEQLGSKEVALEHSIIEGHFVFWQYQNPLASGVGCEFIPVNGTVEEKWHYLQKINSIESYMDKDLGRFAPYFYQAATELGSPAAETEKFAHLLKYPFTTEQYVPQGVEIQFNPEVMPDIQNWVSQLGSHILFIYGEFDPWSAGAFEIPLDKPTLAKYFVPVGNHSAKFTLLPVDSLKKTLETLSNWLGKAPVDTLQFVDSVLEEKGSRQREFLEDLELRSRKLHRLP